MDATDISIGFGGRKGPEAGVAVTCRCGKRCFAAWATNITLGGALLRTDEAVEVDSEIVVQFSIKDPDALESLEIQGKVLRVVESEWKAQPFKLDVQFDLLSPEATEAFHAFLKKSATDELRRAPRIPISLKVQYKHHDRWETGQIEDISEGGLFLLTSSPIPVGETLLLQFLPRDIQASRPIRVMGEVVRNVERGRETGLGIQFKSIQRESKESFAQYIKSLLKSLAAQKGENWPQEAASETELKCSNYGEASSTQPEFSQASMDRNIEGETQEAERSRKRSFFGLFRKRQKDEN